MIQHFDYEVMKGLRGRGAVEAMREEACEGMRPRRGESRRGEGDGEVRSEFAKSVQCLPGDSMQIYNTTDHLNM